MENAYHTHIIRIGNSKGIRIPQKFLTGLGEKVIIKPSKKGLLIQTDEEYPVPPREKWDELFAKAIADGQKPEGDMFDGIDNEGDETEWTWD